MPLSSARLIHRVRAGEPDVGLGLGKALHLSAS
jgi:hypothetical protein